MAKVFNSWKEESKANWGNMLDAKEYLCEEQIKIGAILRIAEAAEKMAQNYTDLQNEKDRYKRWYDSRRQECIRLRHRIAGLKGTITRMKRIKT